MNLEFPDNPMNRSGYGWDPDRIPRVSAFIAVALTFLMNGFVRAGRFIANHTYLLEVAPRERRPLYVGFMNTMTFPFMLSPILGGAIVGIFGYRTLFVIGLLAEFFTRRRMCSISESLATRITSPSMASTRMVWWPTSA